MKTGNSVFFDALRVDNSLPIEQKAVDLWIADLNNPMRWAVRPVLQLIFAVLLHIVWFFKRLPLPQFSAHKLLQKLICWFCRNFVSPEANQLILRHYATESNALNFLADNSPGEAPSRVNIYPTSVDDMIIDSFVDHDQELFRMIKELGHWVSPEHPTTPENLSWQSWRSVDTESYSLPVKRTQVFDFESSHALFMCLFCLLLTREEYRDAINGFNLDQSIAIRIGQIIGDSTLVEMAYNKYPLYLVGPWNLGHRFLMHGFFTEYVYARLESLRLEASGLDSDSSVKIPA